MKKLISYALVLSIVFISACSKDEVAGPQGEQGIQGPQGPAGSVDITVKTVTLYSYDFIEGGTAGDPQHKYSASVSVSEVTSDVYYNGLVIVYYQGFGTTPPPWYSLPQTIYRDGYSYTLTYAHRPGYVIVQRYDSNLYSQAPDFDLTLKIVVIPGSGKKEYDVDFNDYEAVKRYFNLQD